MRMVILLWVTMATPPWLSTAWGLWVGLAGAGTHARVNTGAHTGCCVNTVRVKMWFLVWCIYLYTCIALNRESKTAPDNIAELNCCVRTDLHTAAQSNNTVRWQFSATNLCRTATITKRETLHSAEHTKSRGTTFDRCSNLDMWAGWAPTSTVLCWNLEKDK